MSERKDELEGTISQAGSKLAVLRSLTEHPGWEMHVKLLQEQVLNRQGEILMKPLRSTEQVFLQEYQKGEIQGLTLAQVSIFAVMETLTSQIQVARAQLENEHEIEARISTAGRSRVDGDDDWHGGGPS